MPKAPQKRVRIEKLIEESEHIEDRLSRWQLDSPPDIQEIRAAQRLYLTWYAAALREIPEGDMRTRFIDMYEGGAVIKRLRAFLSEPLATSPLYDPENPNPVFPRWTYPFEDRREELATQREILNVVMHGETTVVTVLDELTAVFRRLPEFLAVLGAAGNDRVRRPTLTNEADLQVLVHAILQLLYDDVRPEDAVPKQAGAASRVDFLLRETGVIIETKMTRPSLTDKKVGEELAIDWNRYQRHPDCQAIIGIVYDPERHISNAAALEHDLSNNDSDPATRVLVIR
ncbi:hypothetical protein [Kribbella sp. NPDC051137]|uniref:PD-(D/E)XK nuclease domain-containing protein n=1 Tax=Kribbella sp. NPDC051137 TaxID=3155045 RepID=UPI003418E24E